MPCVPAYAVTEIISLTTISLLGILDRLSK